MLPIKFFALLLALLPALEAQYDRFGRPACSGPDREFAPRLQPLGQGPDQLSVASRYRSLPSRSIWKITASPAATLSSSAVNSFSVETGCVPTW